jgi:hypothetical protein
MTPSLGWKYGERISSRGLTPTVPSMRRANACALVRAAQQERPLSAIHRVLAQRRAGAGHDHDLSVAHQERPHPFVDQKN